MDTVYLVKGFLSKADKEKRILYNGKSPKKAFNFLDVYAKEAGIVVEIWEDGCFIREIKD